MFIKIKKVYVYQFRNIYQNVNISMLLCYKMILGTMSRVGQIWTIINNEEINIILRLHMCRHKYDLSYVAILHVEFDKVLCKAQSVLEIDENQKLILFFYSKLLNFENSDNNKS